MSDAAIPTVSYRFFGGAVEVDCFGRSSGNWALKGYERSVSEANNPGIGRKIDGLLKTHRIGRLYLPTPRTFNALLASSVDLTVPWYEGRIFRGAEAEGVLLDKVQDACGIASSDCPTIVARNGATGLVVAAHAGRESLYDANKLFNGAAPRRFASVVDAIMDTLLGGDPKSREFIRAHIVCGINRTNFDHPLDDSEQGLRNRKMCAFLNDTWGPDVSWYGHISLPDLIVRQFEMQGVHPFYVRSDRVDTYGEKEDREHRWHSHRRTRSGERNFVLVTRRF